MKLIIILLALGLERGLHFGFFLNRFNWFSNYVNLLHTSNLFKKGGITNGILNQVLILLPLLIITAIVYYFIGRLLYGFIGDVIAFVILLYCLGPGDLYAALSQYFVANAKNEVDTEATYLKDFVILNTEELPQKSRVITTTIFTQFNEMVWAVLFWFMVLGPLGAVLYRSVTLTREYALREGNASLLQGATVCQELLDWIPVRLLSLGFALAGNFVNSFGVWLQGLQSGLSQSHQVLADSGLTALELKKEDASQADISENKAALGLIDRTLILLVVIYALLVLGSYIA